jgi:hypothetical protein
MAGLPGLDRRRFKVRLLSAGGKVHVWIEDRFIVEQAAGSPDAVKDRDDEEERWIGEQPAAGNGTLPLGDQFHHNPGGKGKQG